MNSLSSIEILPIPWPGLSCYFSLFPPPGLFNSHSLFRSQLGHDFFQGVPDCHPTPSLLSSLQFPQFSALPSLQHLSLFSSRVCSFPFVPPLLLWSITLELLTWATLQDNYAYILGISLPWNCPVPYLCQISRPLKFKSKCISLEKSATSIPDMPQMLS